MNSEMIIRPLQSSEDLVSAYYLISHLHPSLLESDFLSRLKQQCISDSYHFIGLFPNLLTPQINAPQQLLALAGYRFASRLSVGKYLYLADLVSDPRFQGKGYGKFLLNHIEQIAIVNDCKQICLDAGLQRQGAHRFYKSQGFEVIYHHFSKNLS